MQRLCPPSPSRRSGVVAVRWRVGTRLAMHWRGRGVARYSVAIRGWIRNPGRRCTVSVLEGSARVGSHPGRMSRRRLQRRRSARICRRRRRRGAGGNSRSGLTGRSVVRRLGLDHGRGLFGHFTPTVEIFPFGYRLGASASVPSSKKLSRIHRGHRGHRGYRGRGPL